MYDGGSDWIDRLFCAIAEEERIHRVVLLLNMRRSAYRIECECDYKVFDFRILCEIVDIGRVVEKFKFISILKFHIGQI